MQILLFLDNLDLFLEMIPKETEKQRLKAWLETTRALMVVSGTTRLFEDLVGYDRPLFGAIIKPNLGLTPEGAAATVSEIYS